MIVAIGRAERRSERRTKVAVLFADRTDRALDLLELLEMAWHDSYGEVTPSEDVIDDVLLAAQPTKKFVQPEEVASLALYLCREEAASVTGANLSMDGGWTAQ